MAAQWLRSGYNEYPKTLVDKRKRALERTALHASSDPDQVRPCVWRVYGLKRITQHSALQLLDATGGRAGGWWRPRVWSQAQDTTVDDINPALPIIRNLP